MAKSAGSLFERSKKGATSTSRYIFKFIYRF